jgi:hypothetical protein
MTVLFVCPPDGKKLSTGRDATDLIGEAASSGAEMIVIPIERLDDDFFRLRTGVAGEIAQKFVTYGKRVAIVGYISQYMEESQSFHDFVYEANRGQDHLWFVTNRDELDRRLGVSQR